MTGSLASVHPELIPEWSEKNLPLTPDKITFGSNKRVWWKGACGHEWETSVKARSKGETRKHLNQENFELFLRKFHIFFELFYSCLNISQIMQFFAFVTK